MVKIVLLVISGRLLYFEKNVADLKRAPEKVSADTGAQSNTVVLVWTSLECEDGQPYISIYEVQYCPVERTGQNCDGNYVYGSVKGRQVNKLSIRFSYSFKFHDHLHFPVFRNSKTKTKQ